MKIEHKILIFAISAALAAVLSIVAYNVYDSTAKVGAYRQCLETNIDIANIISRNDSESIRFSTIPSCSFR